MSRLDTLFNFAQSDLFGDKSAIAFGSNYDMVKLTTLRNQWQNRDFSQLPPIEIISSNVLGNARGAYAASTNKIYLSDSFINTATEEAIKAVILEEIGHYGEYLVEVLFYCPTLVILSRSVVHCFSGDNIKLRTHGRYYVGAVPRVYP